MNLIFIPALCTCVLAMPSNAGATLRNVGRRLFDPSTGELDLSAADSLLERTRRGATDLDMCSYRMQNITKLARVAGEIFMSVDDSPLYRRARNHVSYVNLEQPVGKFCMKLWRKLVKVHADLLTISQMLNEYNFVSRSVEYLIEALQEQMNIHNVNYDKMNKMIPSRTDSRLNMDMVKERAQIQLSHVINELSSLEMTCMVRRKRNL